MEYQKKLKVESLSFKWLALFSYPTRCSMELKTTEYFQGLFDGPINKNPTLISRKILGANDTRVTKLLCYFQAWPSTFYTDSYINIKSSDLQGTYSTAHPWTVENLVHLYFHSNSVKKSITFGVNRILSLVQVALSLKTCGPLSDVTDPLKCKGKTKLLKLIFFCSSIFRLHLPLMPSTEVTMWASQQRSQARTDKNQV